MYSFPNSQIVETAHIAAYNTPTSSINIQDTHLHTGNTPNDISDPYVTFSDPQIAPSSNYSNPEKHHPLDTSIPKYDIPDAQVNECTGFLIDYDVQTVAQPPRTSPDAADLHCPRAGPGRARAIFAGPDPGPQGRATLSLALAR